MSVTILGKLEHTIQGIKMPFYSFKIPAGFPSPAADHIEKHLSLDELFNVRAPHIYLAKIQGDSMQGAGIYDGDLVIVDRSQEAVHGEIVIAALNGDPICKRLHRQGREIILLSENKSYPSRYVLEQDELQIWGVVRYSVRDHDHA